MNPDSYRLPVTSSTAARLYTIAGFLFALIAIVLMSSSVVAAATTIPPGYSSEIIEIKFREDAQVDLLQMTMGLPPHHRNAIARIIKLFTLPKENLDRIRARGRSYSRKALPDLNRWFRITLQPGTDAAAFLEDLRRLHSIEIAEPAPLPQPPPAITPDFTGDQGYLDAAPGGIEARFSWTIPGGNGNGVRIYDVEYSWNQAHEDLSQANGIPLLLNSGDSAVDPFNDNNHGTAVLGEIIADNDTKGVTGISWGANVGLAPANTANLGYNPANAILLTVADGSPGDVILIEQQASVCGLPDFGPSEWISSVFDAIQTAVANRFVVVEAAGNGNVNLDQAACGTTFDRTVRDSGAIIVGAGRPPNSGADRQRESFSSYGSRVDLQGWGSNVTTTGYGSSYTNPDDPTNPNFWYTARFNGTSSASPIVAGAAANLQGIAINRFGTPLTPFQIRELLVATGSPQLGDTTEHIGPRPNLREVISLITEPAIDIFLLVDLSGSFADDLPVFKAQAPSIISTLKASNPNTRFGLGSFEDYSISPFGSAASGDVAYRRNIDLTFDTAAVEAVINGLFTRNGVDLPQSQLPALFQAASGEGQDLSAVGFPGASIPPGQQANFRDGATKLFLLWTDASFHLPGDPGASPYPGPSFAEMVDAILALDPPKVIGISSGGGGLDDLQAIAVATGAVAPPGGVDCDGDGIVDLLEGEPLVCTIASSGAGISEAIIAIVEAATEPTFIAVTIDIHPGSFPNPINPRSRGVIPVAILTTETFDATTVDPLSVRFGPHGAVEAHRRGHIEDADGDGDLDMVLHFNTQETGIQCGDTSASLTGQTFGGQAIQGSDSIVTVGCR